MGNTMNRIFSSGAAISLAMIGIISCSDSGVTDPTGLSPDGLDVDANRIASVAVTVAANPIEVGKTTQATATLLDYQSRLMYTQVIWSSSDTLVASVSSSGLVKGVGAGSASIRARRGSKSGSAAIAVTVAAATTPPPTDSTTPPPTDSTSPTPPPPDSTPTSPPPPTDSTAPPPPPTGSFEPSGMSVISDEKFDVLPSNGCRGYYAYSLVPDVTAPRSPSSVFNVVFPAGFRGGDSPGLTECGINNVAKIYTSLYVQFSSNWQGHLTGVNKIIHFWIGGANHLFLLADGSGSNVLHAGIGLQGIVSSPYGTGAQVQPNIVPNAQFVRGQWHHVEMYATANTAGVANGSVDLWLDGVKVSSVQNIQWTSGAPTFSTAKLDPTWGGLNDSVTSTMFMKVDELYVSGKQ